MLGLLDAFDWGSAFSAGQLGVAVYLALQIKGILANHEQRLTKLEAADAVRPARPARPRRSRK